VENCEKCSEDDIMACGTCSEGFKLDETICKKEGFDICYTGDNEGSNCTSCEEETGKCKECAEGFMVLEGHCAQAEPVDVEVHFQALKQTQVSLTVFKVSQSLGVDEKNVTAATKAEDLRTQDDGVTITYTVMANPEDAVRVRTQAKSKGFAEHLTKELNTIEGLDVKVTKVGADGEESEDDAHMSPLVISLIVVGIVVLLGGLGCVVYQATAGGASPELQYSEDFPTPTADRVSGSRVLSN